MRTGLFIGRFQPLHRGHLLMLKKFAREVDFLIIGLGSVNAEPSCENPFTASERREMIVRGMKELAPTLRPRGSEVGVPTPKDVGRATEYEIVELADFESDEEWVKGVQRVVGKFDIAWSGSEWVLRVFEKYLRTYKSATNSTNAIVIERIKEFPGLSGTKIRRRMAKGLPWLTFVPLSVRKYLREIVAVKRVRTLCQPQ